MIKRIIFDIDNTLIMFPKNYDIWYQKAIDKYKLNIQPKDLYDAIGKYEHDNNIRCDKEKMLNTINEYLHLDLTMDFFENYLNEYSNVLSDVSADDKDTLKYLSSKYELCTLSNWFTESQRERLKRVGILDYFNKVYGTDIVDIKPLESSFREVMGNLKPFECVMVGDNKKMDIEVPAEMGMHVIHFNGDGEYLSVNSLKEIIDIIDKW